MSLSISVEPLVSSHWEAVRLIYLQGIATGNATLQQSPPNWGEWDDAHLKSCRLVAKSGDEILGWAAMSPISPRPVYSGVAETSIYVSEAARGRGVGKLLLSSLIKGSEQSGIWTLQAGIFPENAASMALHVALGFRVVGTRARLGAMNGRWRDVVLLERRSDVVGRSAEVS